MRIVDFSKQKAAPADPEIVGHIGSADENFLSEVVRCLSFPRHYMAERDSNRRAGAWVAGVFRSRGYDVSMMGPFGNVVATHPLIPEGPRVLVGSHYDTAPGTPGADDNGSAVAVMLACARVLTRCPRTAPVVFVSFNHEEDNLLGSTQFLEDYPLDRSPAIAVAHILEMVGFRTYRSGSQRLPTGLPVKGPDVGDFLAILCNRNSNHLVEPLLRDAVTYCPQLHALGLHVYLGLEKCFPHLLRSDHAPFWRAGIPALMWTDTSEFRNANYHGVSDTPETLDYAFMKEVAQLLLVSIFRYGKETRHPTSAPG